MFEAGTGVGRHIAFAPSEQPPCATLLTPDREWDDGRIVLVFEVGNDRVVVEAPVQIQPLDSQTDFLRTNKQSLEGIQGRIRASHQCKGQGISLVVVHDVEGGIAVEVGCSTFGATPSHQIVFSFVTPRGSR